MSNIFEHSDNPFFLAIMGELCALSNPLMKIQVRFSTSHFVLNRNIGQKYGLAVAPFRRYVRGRFLKPQFKTK